MMRFAIIAMLCAGCRQLLGFDEIAPASSCATSCATDADCPEGLLCAEGVCRAPGVSCSDAATDAISPTATCAGSAAGPLGTICFDPPSAPTTLSGSLDTDVEGTCALRTLGGVELCIVVVDQITSDVQITGSRPIMLWSASTLSISGLVDVASGQTPARSGAGGNHVGCSPSSSMNGSIDAANEGASGGAGGSFGSNGGAGGASSLQPGGAAVPTAIAFHGGCLGGIGGDQLDLQTAGHGGGGIYLVAHDQISISGRINASGGGAFTPPSKAGGAGGGSGGMIVIDAPAVEIQSGAVLLAIGGGGAAGGSLTLAGAPGHDPTLTSPFKAAPAAGPSCGGTGGGGSSGDGSDGQSGASTSSSGCSAGGGGGGDGVIAINLTAVIAGAVVRPPPRQF